MTMKKVPVINRVDDNLMFFVILNGLLLNNIKLIKCQLANSKDNNKDNNKGSMGNQTTTHLMTMPNTQYIQINS
jgi:hypothetical protein